MRVKQYPIVPAGNGPLWTAVVTAIVVVATHVFVVADIWSTVSAAVLVGIALPMIGVPVVIFYIALAARRMRLVIDGTRLTIVGFMGRSLPLSSLELSNAKVLDLDTQKEYRVTGNVFGSKMPGFNVGHCRLGTREKAIVYLTDKRSVVYIPTREGYALLVSVAQPRNVLDTLREAVSEPATVK